MATDIEIIIGTYEEYLVGYKVEPSKKDKYDLVLHQSFAKRSHTSSVRCVANCGRYMASGGADDRIFVVDMLTRSEVQIITCHEATVNTLQFSPEGSHLFSGGSDGVLAATRVGNWITEVKWPKAHNKESVNCVSIHPSGKLALSLGGDLTLRTWNLIKGRQAYTTNLKTKPNLNRIVECVVWSPGGEYFLVTGAKVFEILSSATATVMKSLNCDSKPVCACWINDTIAAVGLENGHVLLYDMEQDDDEPVKIKAHSSRVKGIDRLHDFVVTISSSGDVTLWQYEDMDLAEICSTNIGCRPTCLTLIDLKGFADDYVLKREDSESESEEVPAIVDARKIPTSGTVTVEYDDDDTEDSNKLKSAKKRVKANKSKEVEEIKPPKKVKRISVANLSSKKLGGFVEEDEEEIETPIKARINRKSISQSFREEDDFADLEHEENVRKTKLMNLSVGSLPKKTTKKNSRKSIA